MLFRIAGWTDYGFIYYIQSRIAQLFFFFLRRFLVVLGPDTNKKTSKQTRKTIQDTMNKHRAHHSIFNIVIVTFIRGRPNGPVRV